MILASMGHFRTLALDGDDKLGFDFKGDRVLCRFKAKDAKFQKIIKDLKNAAKKASKIFIATDPDREGEAIAWHLKEAIGGDDSRYQRVVFNEITKKAITWFAAIAAASLPPFW